MVADETIDTPNPADLDLEDLALPDDFFIIPDERDYLLYAPFSPGVAKVNAAAVRRLRQVQAGQATFAAFSPAFLSELVDHGILLGRDQAAARQPFPQKGEYDPDGITLFLTTKCTLACSYCYASAGDRPALMPWDTAKAGLDWMFRHAAARGKPRVSVMFHGGGEVTAASRLLERCLAYARAEAASRNMTLQTSAGLNGVMAGRVLEWVIANIGSATVSLDGLPEVHNAQRPLVNGKGSFDVIAAALSRMDEAGFQYGLRATVTGASVAKMAESVDFMCQRFRARVIHLEPMFRSGRARAQDLAVPDPHEFVRGFRLARAVAHSYGRQLMYSGARFGTLSNKFCQVSDDLLALTPDGLVSSCYEIGANDDPRASTFVYGRLDPDTGELEIDMEKVSRLRQLTVEHKPSCTGCFCRWSCGGECAAKLALAGNAWDATESSRCIINRELTLDQIRDYLGRGGGPLVPPPESARA